MDNMHAQHHESIIEMEGKVCDQVIYILIHPTFNYNYVSPDVVDEYGLSKDLHEESMLNMYLVSQKFKDVFPEDIIEIPSHREVELSIELVPEKYPKSKAPYMMSTP